MLLYSDNSAGDISQNSCKILAQVRNTPTEISDEDMKQSFYEQLNAIQERLLKGVIANIMRDLNGKDAFVCGFLQLPRPCQGSTLFGHRVHCKVSWVSTDRQRTSSQINHIAISTIFRICETRETLTPSSEASSDGCLHLLPCCLYV